MKASNLIILLVIVLLVMYVFWYRSNRANSIAFEPKVDTSYVHGGDTLPVSKRYEHKRTIKEWHETDLGVSQDVSHQVPTDYNGNSNNWDDDLEHIKK